MTNEELIERHHVDQVRRGLLPNSIDKRDRAVTVFAGSLDGRSLLEATRDDVEQFLDRRKIGPRTRYSWLTHLHNFYAWTIWDELGATDPTAKIRRPRLPRALPRPAVTDELRLAVEQADPMRRCWVLLAAYQGLRCQEIAGIRREDILEEEGYLRVVHGKGAKERLLPLHPDVMAALRTLPLPRIGWLFTRPRGGPFPAAQLGQEFNRFLRDAGVTGSAHTLRHWFGSTTYANTRDLRTVQELLGHASPQTTAIYTVFDLEAAGAAVRSLSMEEK
jgi:integrase/recombinase XerC